MAALGCGALACHAAAAAPARLAARSAWSVRAAGLRRSSGARLGPAVGARALAGRRLGALESRGVRGGRLRSVASDATGGPNTDVEAERSDMVNEQLLLFIFQLDLDTQLERALNLEAFEAAKQIRERREQLDAMVVKFEETKKGRSGTTATSSTDVRDTVSEGLLLRSELTRAIEEEDYAAAARLRDELASLEEGANQLQASMEAERLDQAQPLFEVGQRFVHTQKGYQGVIVGWDRTCCEEEGWRERAQVGRLARREKQPFYHVLVDQDNSNWAEDDKRAPVAYVAEELIKVPREQSWLEVYGERDVRHPYHYLLFFGKDARGDLIPTTALRERYGQARKDVYPDGQDGWEDDEEDGADQGDAGQEGTQEGEGEGPGSSTDGPSKQ